MWWIFGKNKNNKFDEEVNSEVQSMKYLMTTKRDEALDVIIRIQKQQYEHINMFCRKDWTEAEKSLLEIMRENIFKLNLVLLELREQLKKEN